MRIAGNRIIGYNEGLRIVYSRDRTEKGIEVAPKGRPYVSNTLLSIELYLMRHRFHGTTNNQVRNQPSRAYPSPTVSAR